MKKKDKIYDSPEYKQIREHLPEILKEMERDKGLKQYQMPEGWNEDFERIYQAEHRKERHGNRILAGCMCSDHSWHWSRSCGRASGADFDGAGG